MNSFSEAICQECEMPLYNTGADLLFFAHVPKCAGLSIDRHLTDRFGKPALSDFGYLDFPEGSRWTRTAPQHIPADRLRRLFPKGFADASFAFVRDPATRIVSAFHYQRDKEGTIPVDTSLNDWIVELPNLISNDQWAFDGHFQPMSRFIPDDATVFKLEDGFDPFLDWLSLRYGAGPRDIPILNAGFSAERLLVLSDQARAVIEDLYADDYLRFDYQRVTTRRDATPSGNRADILHSLGLGALGRRQFAPARDLFGRALDANPTHSNALAAVAVLEVMTENYPTAAERAKSALEQDKSLADAHLALIQARLMTGFIEDADEAISNARRALGDLPELDLQSSLIAGRRCEYDLALSLAASVIAQAAAKGASVLRSEAQAVWGRLVKAAMDDVTAFAELCDAVGLVPGHGAIVSQEPARDPVVIRLGTGGTTNDVGCLLAGPNLDTELRAILDTAKGRDVVFIRERDTFAEDAIPQLLKKWAGSGWAALGTAWVSEPLLAAAPPAPEPLRAAIRRAFAAAHAPTSLSILFGGAVVLSAEAVSIAIAHCQDPFTDLDQVIPAITLAVADAGLPVGSWIGAHASPAGRVDPILSDRALASLCAQAGDLRVILALQLAQEACQNRRLSVALTAAALPDRRNLLAAMIHQESSDLPTSLRYSAFAALWPSDPETALSALTALERGERQTDLLPFDLPTSERPILSIIIPAHNHIGATYCTLSSLRLQSVAVPFEVILVDDGSTDATASIETRVGGLRVVRHATAKRFIAACNAGAEQARGAYLLFLNNDTEPSPGSLDGLMDACRAGAGLAGARLILPNGILQEAGGLLDNQAQPANYGSGRHPLDPRYSYCREADYLSGAALMISRDVWDKVNGFSTYLEGMYYEDTDLACKVRALGLPVRYVPAAIVIHHEGTTSGKDITKGPKALQAINAPRFRTRWAEFLKNNPPSDTPMEIAADHRARGRILFVDYSIPRPDHDAGGHASFEEMRMMCAAGWKVTFIDASATYLPGYVEALQALGVEVLHRPFATSPLAAVIGRGTTIDILYVSRYWLAQDVIPMLRKVNPEAGVIVNVADLHFLRQMREARVRGDLPALTKARAVKIQEIAALELADLVLSYSATESAILWEATEGGIESRLCPWSDEIASSAKPLAGRSGLSFLGGFGHPPNQQGLTWFIDAVLPRLTGLTLDVYGSEAGAEILAMASSQVRIQGYVADVSTCFDRHRIFVSPLLAGAGVKGKVIKALCHGMPSVLSPIAAEGLGLVHGVHAFIAKTPADWAEAIDLLSSNDALWQRMSEAALDHARRHYGRASATEDMAKILADLAPRTAKRNLPSQSSVPSQAVRAPTRVTNSRFAPRFALRFEVQHYGSHHSAMWLAGLLAHPHHSLHLNLDTDGAKLSQAEEALSSLAGQFCQLGLTRSANLRWGGPSIFLALIDRFRHALAAPGWDYLINLSGTCGPLQPLNLLDAYLSQTHDQGKRAHCHVFPIGDGPRLPVLAHHEPLLRGNAGRLQLRGQATLLDWFRDPGRNPLTNTENRLFVNVSEPEGERNLLDVRPLTKEEFELRRQVLSRIQPYAGRAWYALHRSVVEALIRYLDDPQSEALRAALLPSFMPEEHLIQTIFANGLIMDVDRLCPANLHRDQGAPRVYKDEHLSEVLNSQDGFFMRKLDESQSGVLRGVLAERIRGFLSGPLT